MPYADKDKQRAYLVAYEAKRTERMKNDTAFAEKRKAQAAASYLKHRKTRLAKQKAFLIANPEARQRVKGEQARYRARNRELLRERARNRAATPAGKKRYAAYRKTAKGLEAQRKGARNYYEKNNLEMEAKDYLKRGLGIPSACLSNELIELKKNPSANQTKGKKSCKSLTTLQHCAAILATFSPS